jgi:hypothetical protein
MLPTSAECRTVAEEKLAETSVTAGVLLKAGSFLPIN